MLAGVKSYAIFLIKTAWVGNVIEALAGTGRRWADADQPIGAAGAGTYDPLAVVPDSAAPGLALNVETLAGIAFRVMTTMI